MRDPSLLRFLVDMRGEDVDDKQARAGPREGGQGDHCAALLLLLLLLSSGRGDVEPAAAALPPFSPSRLALTLAASLRPNLQ